MDEQTRNEIKSVISEAISAHTTERAALNAEIEQLKTELQAKGVELESLTSQLNAVTEERDKAKADSEEEVNACKKREQEQAELCVRVSNELRELKGKACVNELDTMLTNFTAKEQECAAEEIEKFRADPLGCGIELNQIDTKISAEAFRAMKRSSNKPGAKAELNAFTGPDIFAPMSPECEQLGDFDPAKAIV